MVEAAPPATFEMSEPDLLLEFLIVTFDAPAQFGNINKRRKLDRCRSRTRNRAPISAPSQHSRPPPVTARGTRSQPLPPPPTSPVRCRDRRTARRQIAGHHRRSGAAHRCGCRRSGRRIRGRLPLRRRPRRDRSTSQAAHGSSAPPSRASRRRNSASAASTRRASA